MAIILMVGLHFLIPVRQIIQAPYRYLGIIPLAAGLAVGLWAAGIFERAGTIIKPVEIAGWADTCPP